MFGGDRDRGVKGRTLYHPGIRARVGEGSVVAVMGTVVKVARRNLGSRRGYLMASMMIGWLRGARTGAGLPLATPCCPLPGLPRKGRCYQPHIVSMVSPQEDREQGASVATTERRKLAARSGAN